MTLRDAAALAAGNLRLSPLRTLLTILGMAVGVGAIVTVLTLGGAGEIRVEEEISRLGVDKVWIHAQEPDAPLSNEDGAIVSAAVNASACAGVYMAGAVRCAGETALAQICGFDERFEAVHRPLLIEGRMIAAREFRDGSTVALADEALADCLGGDVIGSRVDVGSRKVRIIGVIDGMATQTLSGMSGMLVLPLETFLDTWNAPVGEVSISVAPDQEAGLVACDAVAALEKRGGAFRATTLEEEIDAAKSVVRIFVMVLGCVAAVCMLNGAIGVMNILLVSVRERQQEIGLIKAIGGTSGQVALLFLLEAAGYALLGGAAGLVLGAAMTGLCGWWIGLEAEVSAAVALPCVLGAGVIGLACGVAPALRAAALEPVRALRRE